MTILVRGNDGLGTACSPGVPGSATCSTLNCAMTVSDNTTNVLCNGDATGEIDLTVGNGSPSYTFAWSNTETTEDVTGLIGGTYFVTVTDAVGCSVTDTISVWEPAKGLGLT